MTEWTLICHVHDIPALGARRVARPQGLEVALFRNQQDEVFALLDRCPHRQGPLSQGIVHGHAVTCPLHAWTIDLASGEPTGADAGKGCVTSFQIQVTDGRVLIATAATAKA